MSKPEIEITAEIAAKVLATVDAGLIAGVGVPIPGKMCVEAAVNYALGRPHGDDPGCVDAALRRLKIVLNDAFQGNSAERARALRRLAIAQLGSKGVLDTYAFVTRCAALSMQYSASSAEDAAQYAEKSAEYAAKYAAASAEYAAAYAAKYAAKSAEYVANSAEYAARSAKDAKYFATHNQVLANYCEGVVQILMDLKSPGCAFLYLTEET